MRAKAKAVVVSAVLMAGVMVPMLAYGASGSYTRPYYPALQGSFFTPCATQLQVGQFRNDVNGVCFKLNGTESLPASVSIVDVAGVKVKGSLRFLQFGSPAAGGSGWEELDGRYFCGNTIVLDQIPVPDYPNAFFLQVQLGAGEMIGCPGTVGAGTTGNITFHYTTP